MLSTAVSAAEQVQVTWSEENNSELRYWDGQNVQTLSNNAERVQLSEGNFLWLEGNDLKLWNGTSIADVASLDDTRFSIGFFDEKVAYSVNDDIVLYENGETQTIFSNTTIDAGVSVRAVSKDLVVMGVTSRRFIETKYLVWDGIQIRDLNDMSGSSSDSQGPFLDVEGETIVWNHQPFMREGWINVWDGVNHVEIREAGLSFRRPQLSGGTVVFEGRDDSGLSQIYAWSNGSLSQITDSDFDHTLPQVSEGRIVWLAWDGNDNEVFTFKNGETIQLTDNDVDDTDVKVASDYVVWSSQVDEDYEVFVWNGSTTTRLTNTNEWSRLPQVSVVERDTVPSLADCTVTKNTVYAMQNLNSGLLLDVARASRENGANIKQFGNNVPTHRQFQALSKGRGYFGFRGIASRLFIDVAGASTAEGANVQQWGRNANVTHRQFTVEAGVNGACVIKARHSGMCLGVAGASLVNNGNVEQQFCSGARAQEWILIEQ